MYLVVLGAILLLLPLYMEGLGAPKAWMLFPLLSLYALIIAALMVSRVRTFSGKLIGRRIARDYIAPVIALVVVLAATLVTYPYMSLTLGCLTYLALIPISLRRHFELKQEYATIQAPALSHGVPPARTAETQP